MNATEPDDPLRTTDHTSDLGRASELPIGSASSAGATRSNASSEFTRSYQPGDSEQAPTLHAPDSATPTVPGYEILGVLGRGGMGVVYKARQLALKRVVALKMVLAGGHASPQDRERFRREAEAAARLQHPNIVQIHEVGESGGHPYCALEFVEGGTLAGKIAGNPLPARSSARLVEALARAMQLAHSRNVVHRDLKPANILLTADGTPKIADIGLARQLDSDSGATQAGAVIGTPSYMAPEQAAGRAHEAGPAADVYSLGAILYDCLAGRPPFQGKTVAETLDQVRTQEPVPPSRLRKGVSPDLETICLKCLRKEPEKRYASAAELADDLVRHQRGEPILARPVGRVERAWKWARRSPAKAAAGAVAALAVVGGVVAGFLFQQALADQRVHAEEKRVSDLAIAYAEVEQEKDKLESALARTCLSPLTEASGPLNDAEMGAFAEVAADRGNPVAKRFVTLALHDSQGMRKLGARFPYALHAVVGLDERERQAFERLLEDKLKGLDASDASATNLALAASQLGALSPDAATAVAKALLPALGKPSDPAALVSVAQGLSAVADRLEPKEAALAAATLTQAMARTGDPQVLQALVRSLSSVTARLDSQAASKVANALAQAIARTNNTLAAGSLAQSLSAVALSMHPKDAAAMLLGVMSRPNLHPYVLKFLAPGLSAIASRLGPKEAAEVAAAITGAMTRTANSGASQSLSQCLSAVAARLDPPEAAKAAATLLQGFNRPLGFVDHENLVRGLSLLSPRLDPKAAAKIVAAFTPALIKTNNPAVRPTMARVLGAMAPRLESREAAEAALALIDAMAKTADAASVIPLVEGMSSLAERLESSDCDEAAAKLAPIIAATDDFGALNNLVRGLAKLAVRLQPMQAAKLAAVLSEAMTKANDPLPLGPLAEALSSAAARLEPGEAARATAAAFAALTHSMGKTNEAVGLWSLARGLSALASFQEPSEAIRTFSRMAATLIQALEKTTNPIAMHDLATGLSAVADRLEPRQAADAVAILARAVTRTKDASTLQSLLQAFSATAARLDAGEAAKAVALLKKAAAESNDAYTLRHLAECLPAVAARLEPREAAATLASAIAKTTSPFDLKVLAEVLAEVAAKLEPRDAARTCAEAASSLTQAMSATNDPYALGALGKGLSALAARLEPQEAAETVASFARALDKTRDPYALRLLAEALSVGAARLEPDEAAKAAGILIHTLARTNVSDPLQPLLTRGLEAALGDGRRHERPLAVAATVGALHDGRGLLGSLMLLQPALEPSPRRLSDQQLVDLLKQPLCVGPARRAILDHLGHHHRRPFADQWDFVRHAEEAGLGLDFAIPPRK